MNHTQVFIYVRNPLQADGYPLAVCEIGGQLSIPEKAAHDYRNGIKKGISKQ